MSIERKIAELLAEAKTLQEESTEAVVEETTEEVDAEATQEFTTEEFISEEQYLTLSEEEKQNYEPISEEQLDEISQELVKKYYNKVSRKAVKKEFPTKDSKEDLPYHAQQNIAHSKLPKNRKDGIGRALNRQAGGQDYYNSKEHKDSTVKKIREMTVDVTEDVAALTNGEDLSEEFKTKAATIFEAAVITRVKAEVTKLQEEFDNQLAEQVEEIKEGLVDKVDGYLNYIVEQWIAQNEIALESGMKSEILESFVQGLKGVFEEHYIDVPEEKFDVLGDMQEKLEQLESKLDETVATNVDLTKQINEQKRIASVVEAADGLADTDVEKFKGLAEELSYEDAESFKKKLQTIRENYFTNKSTTLVESVVTDSPVITEEYKAVDPMMKSYLSVLNSIKK